MELLKRNTPINGGFSSHVRLPINHPQLATGGLVVAVPRRWVVLVFVSGIRVEFMEAPKMAALEVENSTWQTFVASIGISLVTQTHAEFDVGNFTTLLRLPGLGLGIKHGNNPHSQEANHLWMGMRKYIWNTHLHHITSTSNRQGRLERVRILTIPLGGSSFRQIAPASQNTKGHQSAQDLQDIPWMERNCSWMAP